MILHFLKRDNKGFTLVDIIIVGAVIAILVVLTFPMMSDFLMLQNEKEEEEAQREILRTINVMAQEDLEIPVTHDIDVFAEEAQSYGNYPKADIMEDAFKNDRYYRAGVQTETYRDASFDVHYAVLYSTGVDGCWGEAVACDANDISNNVTNLLGVNPASYEASFSAIEVPYGDFLIKFTDRDLQKERYKKTVHRLERLTEALVQYGALKRYEGIADGVSSSLIFFPPSDGPATDTQTATITYDNVENEIEDELDEVLGAGVTDFVLNDNNDVNDKMDRRLSMIALARVLGLPDEYCCNALKTFEMDDQKFEEGFFYYSNPMSRINPAGGVCGTPATAAEDRKLPPRITVDEDPCGK